MKKGKKMSDHQKKKISESMKRSHARKTMVQKARTSEKKRQAMLDYWASLPSGEKIGSSKLK